MGLRKTKKKFGGFSPMGFAKTAAGTVKKAFKVALHPETAFKKEVDYKITERIKDYALK